MLARAPTIQSRAMTPDVIKDRLATKPFRPFVLELDSAERFEVRCSELVSLSPGGRRMIFWADAERAVHIDVTRIESLQEPNGHKRRRAS